MFELLLPLAGGIVEAPAVDVPMATPSLLLAGRTLLVLDDDQAVCAALADLLERWGAQVACANDMASLHASLCRMATPPDFVIADFQFDRGFSGADALTAVRLHFQAPIPGAILTGNVGLVPSEIMADPALQVFSKPFSPAKLRALLHHSLKNPGLSQAH